MFSHNQIKKRKLIYNNISKFDFKSKENLVFIKKNQFHSEIVQLVNLFLDENLNTYFNKKYINLKSSINHIIKLPNLTPNGILFPKKETQLIQTLFGDNASSSSLDTVKDIFSVANMLSSNWNQLSDIHQWEQTLWYYIMPRIEQGIPSVIDTFNISNETNQDIINDYLVSLNEIIVMITDYYKYQEKKLTTTIRETIVTNLKLPHTLSLSQLAIDCLQQTHGVDCVLVGMRQENYVISVLNGLEHSQKIEINSNWKHLNSSLLQMVQKGRQ